MEKHSSNKLIGISYLRIAATIAVIALHTAGTVTTSIPDLEKNLHSFFVLIMALVDWAVPVFFMITGSLLLNPEKEITTEKCLKKYVLRFILALFVFGIPFALLMLIFEQKTFNLEILIKSIEAVFTGDSFGHLWYLYVLIGIYVILPVLRTFVKNSTKKDILIIITALFVFDFIIPAVSFFTGKAIEFSIPFTYPIFYFLTGHYISINKPVILCHKNFNVIAILIMSALIAVFVYTGVPLALLGNSGPMTAIISIFIFSSFTICENKWKNVNSDLVWKFDRLCFGVYLIHPVFIQFAYRFLKLTPASFEMYYLAIIPFFIIFTVCSFFASWVMSLIKPLKKYIL